MVQDRPNILVVMSDQHTPAVIGAYGNRHIQTPNMDRLANEGVKFENAYCSYPLCVPSRQSFLTGQSTQTLEVFSLSDTIRNDLVT